MVIEVASVLGIDATDMDVEVPNVPLACVEDDSEKELTPEPDSKTTSLNVNESSNIENGNFSTLKPTNQQNSSGNNNSSISSNSSNSSTDNFGFGEGGYLSTSLQSLVETFDQKVNKCLKDMDENTTTMAPVPIRTQEEIMSESQVWWTLTGNYGNILPLDFNKTRIRADQLDALGLSSSTRQSENSDNGYDLNDEEDIRQQLDFHQLVTQNLSLPNEIPPVSADQVIEEIDEMIQSCDLLASMTTDRTMESVDSMYSSMRSPYTGSSINSQNEVDSKMKQASVITSTTENLESLPTNKLLTLASEMEQLIRIYNEALVENLAHRDELEFEKEVKNTFISLLLSIQNKRRAYHNERKRKGLRIDVSQMPQFAVATIPHDESKKVIDTPTLEALIKIMKAIEDDSNNVPSMLTDYILTFVCPSTTTSMIVDNTLSINQMTSSTISNGTILKGNY
ncbi:Unc-76 [Strongyloides ratti]|uniref:Unc-76 n=1 Tax=Strongyloides ratti TaxID=34506 RepID=A0A090KY97_STRRB|nr:Unc-76 [Strongyloides ratti]CEF62406.1 Unc-76 [Strongyloides ratti]